MEEYRPKDEAELAELLRDLNESEAAVVPVGGGTHQHLAATPATDALAVHLDAIEGVVFHEPDDMVAAFRAGTSLREVQEVLARGQQRLHLDPALEESTLGGCFAVDHYGPRCHGWGTLRDQVLGVSYVLPDGRQIRGGGKVMKNVAGYDLSRLMIGSMGTLGVITEVIFRANPLMDTERGWLAPCATLAEAWETCVRIQSQQLEPHVLCALDAVAASELAGINNAAGGYVLMAAEGVAEFVDIHQQRLRELCGDVTVLDDEQCLAAWAAWAPAVHGSSSLTARVGAATSRWAPVLELAADCEGAFLMPGRGIGFLRLPSMAALDEMRAAALGVGGYAVAWSRDGELEPPQMWGPARDDAALMRAIKQVHDPNAILNAGRFYAGI